MPTGATGEGGAIRRGAGAAATRAGATGRDTTATADGDGASFRHISANRASKTVATHPANNPRLSQLFVVMFLILYGEERFTPPFVLQEHSVAKE